MTTQELFKDIMEAVVQGSGLPQADILASRTEECTNARVVLVHALGRYLNNAQIAKLLSRTKQGVSCLRAMWDDKKHRWDVASNWQVVGKLLASKEWWGK